MMSYSVQIAQGLWEINTEKYQDVYLRERFSAFLSRPKEERLKFIQKNLGNTYDGYSFPKQKDSFNQAPEDELHSFVITSLEKHCDLPEELKFDQSTLWRSLQDQVTQIERHLLVETRIAHEGDSAPMLSCNYYPEKKKAWKGLEEHPDISLFTHFPFGSDGFTEYKDLNGEWHPFPKTDNWLVFTGYFMEYISQEKVKALQHRVGVLPAHIERFAFAWFTIPHPKSQWIHGGETMSGADYHKAYLTLFE